MGKDRELIFEPVAMRYQWDIQVESAFSNGCGDQKLGRKIWKKNFGLIRMWGWPLPEAIGEFVIIQGKHREYKDRKTVMHMQDVFRLQT